MSYTLTRISQSEDGTFGILKDEAGNRLCVTCEPPLTGNHPCIPKGIYHCIPHNSLAHPNTWELQNVPGRSEILIHTGNTIKDTKGCILVGKSFGWIDSEQAVTESNATLDMLRESFPPEFDITIINDFQP